jgi:pseudomonalisin
MKRHLHFIGVSITLLLVSITALAQHERAIREPINDNDTVVRDRDIHPLARPEFDRGRADSSQRMDKMVLVMNLGPGKDKEVDHLIEQQQDPSSPLFHHWLQPEEFGARFGMNEDDLLTVTGWLESHGFEVDAVAKGNRAITFSGTVAQVEEAFHTEIRKYLVHGEMHHANATAPAIPRALDAAVKGVLSLHDFVAKSQAHSGVATPDFTTGVAPSQNHFLTPGDFAAIYNVKPLYDAGIDGSLISIAIVARSDIDLSVVQKFRSDFGLPVNAPHIPDGVTSPGRQGTVRKNATGQEDELEALIDVEWAGAVARKANILYVPFLTTKATDGVALSAQFIVDHGIAPIVSMSFGQCEPFMATATTKFWQMLWQQAVAQGMTVFVSSGDSGAMGCDLPTETVPGVGIPAVNGFCSTPNDTCVGGTSFNDTANPSLYWNSVNATDGTSAISYIPEVAWNEAGTTIGNIKGIFASGGGVSENWPKPSWQSGPGVPADGMRDVPDVSLSAAAHDGYVIQLFRPNLVAFAAGTSLATPSFAGLMALVEQKWGPYQGNANPVLYPLARPSRTSLLCGRVSPFHDITAGNNAVSTATAMISFSAGAGYDQVTGLGSVNANTLVAEWGPSSPNCTLLP